MTGWTLGVALRCAFSVGCEQEGKTEAQPRLSAESRIAEPADDRRTEPARSASFDRNAEEANVKTLVTRYRDMIYGKNGEGAAEVVTASRHAYFESARTGALKANAAEVKAKLADQLATIDPNQDKTIFRVLELLAKGKPVDISVFEPLDKAEK